MALLAKQSKVKQPPNFESKQIRPPNTIEVVDKIASAESATTEGAFKILKEVHETIRKK